MMLADCRCALMLADWRCAMMLADCCALMLADCRCALMLADWRYALMLADKQTVFFVILLSSVRPPRCSFDSAKWPLGERAENISPCAGEADKHIVSISFLPDTSTVFKVKLYSSEVE